MSQADDSDAWADTQRVEGWAGEIRLNLVRLLAIALFYGRHLVEVIASPPGSDIRGAFHAKVTWVCLVWGGAAILLHLWLVRRRFSIWLKYLVIVYDAAMITFLCVLSGGPRTPLVLLYFPLIASAPLRLSLPLVYSATAGAIVGYLVVLGYYAWYIIGFHKYYSTPELRIPRRDEAIMVLALLVTGLLCGQVVRQIRRIAQGHRVTVATAGG